MKTVIITGSSRGIGYAAAEYFGMHGWQVVINGSHDLDGLLQAEIQLKDQGISVISVPGDVGTVKFWREAVDKTIKHFGRIDCVINNAAVSYVGLLTDMSEEEWHTVINTNLNAAFYSMKAVLPSMISQKYGRIIHVTSVWGEQGASCEVAYSASKGGVIAFTKALAKELAPSHISVNALSLGMFDTQMNACFSEEEKQAIIDEIPADRMGNPSEAAAMLYSIANAPEYMTGQIIRLDGGWI
jgi:3-oxoacyl-[acyl-carrier protein] reductase